jgi:hypothetical protein
MLPRDEVSGECLPLEWGPHGPPAHLSCPRLSNRQVATITTEGKLIETK